VLEDVGLDTLHELDIVVGELEWGPLEVHVAGRAGEHEAEIDVNDMAVDIYEDVVIVPILDVEVVLDERVPSQALYEISQAGLPVHPKDLSIDIL
jgi:hypothetical protein